VQVMLEEAVAIVMSPRDSKNRRCGIFRLTTPGGMDLIKDCSQTGFHTHAPTANGQKIYELCGHVRQLLLPPC
jgi:STAM-binding protein